MMQKKAKNLNGNAIQKKRNGNRTRRRNTQQEEQNNVALKYSLLREIFLNTYNFQLSPAHLIFSMLRQIHVEWIERINVG